MWNLPDDCTANDLRNILQDRRRQAKIKQGMEIDLADLQNDQGKLMEIIQESVSK